MAIVAYEIPGQLLSLEAAADLSAKQYFFVKIDTDGKMALCGNGERAIGVLQDKPVSGAFGTVMTSGVSRLVAGAAIDHGALVCCDASGKGESATTTGDFALGTALTEAAADLSHISILINSAGVKIP